jgi:RNA polymerase sigma factor (sigma-70 family)
MNDFELVRCYAEERSEAAFAELVKRYIDFVYSAALRQVGGDAHLAEDVVQSVFVDLARKAGSFAEHTVLSGWLYTGTRYAAAKAVRHEQRRRAREQESFIMQEPFNGATGESSWDTVQPVLDSAMHALSERDRNAVLLRYFENRPLSEVGARLGLSEDGARMRVRRALEKLRDLLGRRGVSSTSAALATLLAQQTVSAAPAGLAGNIVGTALTSTAGSGPVLALLNLMNAKLKVGIVTAVVVAGVATPLAIHERTQRDLRAENAALRRQIDELSPLAAENERLANLLAQRAAAPVVAQTEPSSELLKLRGEVGRLREENRELARPKTASSETAKDTPFDATLQTLAARATQLQEGFKRMPHQTIPELQLLTPQDWLRVADNGKRLETEEDMRQAFSELRARAKAGLAVNLCNALQQFVENNNGMLPADLSQLRPYLDPPADPAMLERYRLVQSGKLSDLGKNAMVIAETAPPVDREYDTQNQFSFNGRDIQFLLRPLNPGSMPQRRGG